MDVHEQFYQRYVTLDKEVLRD